jgi:hypothetical protein
MECCQPSADFLCILIDHPRIPVEEKEAILRQIAYLAELEEDTLPSNPEDYYLSLGTTESECESPLERRAERSPSGESPSPEKVNLRGGGGAPVKPRWRIYDHEHAIKGCNFQVDNSHLPGALRRGEHDPPVLIADDNSGSANALYDTIEQTVVFFKMVFGHDPGLGKNYLVAS